MLWHLFMMLGTLVTAASSAAPTAQFRDIGGPPAGWQFLANSALTSPDCRRVGYRLLRGDELALADCEDLWGRARTMVDPVFSPDSAAISTVWQQGSRWWLRFGETNLEAFEPVTSPRIDPHGARLAYVARGESQQFVVEGNIPHRTFADVDAASLSFSADGSLLAYRAIEGGWHHCIVVEGEVDSRWDHVPKGPIFAPVGQRMAFVAAKGLWQHVVVDGQPGPPWRRIHDLPRFSADGSRIGYWAQCDGGQWVLVLDNRADTTITADRPGAILFSPDGRHVAASGKRGPAWHIFRDGKSATAFDAVGSDSLLFSPDGSRLAFGAMSNGRWRVVCDGLADTVPASGLLPGSLRFSPDSQRFAYACLDQGQWYVVLDGVRQNRFLGIDAGSIQFSADSRRFTYAGKADTKWAVVLDGSTYGWVDKIEALTFNPDSRHLLWVAHWGEQARLVVNGQVCAQPFNALVRGAEIAFSGDTQARTVVVRKPGPRFGLLTVALEGGLPLADVPTQ